jgi:hypothetical protein
MGSWLFYVIIQAAQEDFLWIVKILYSVNLTTSFIKLLTLNAAIKTIMGNFNTEIAW